MRKREEMDLKKRMLRLMATLFMAVISLGITGTAGAADFGHDKRILFIPLDNRPITDQQTREAGAAAGYEMVLPPEEFLGNADQYGNPDGLWSWLQDHAPGAEAAVVSTDALLYGSLVGSRNHELDREIISERVQRLRELHERFPRLAVYGYGTVLRTLLSQTHSAPGMEPGDYQKYASKIRDYSMLRDKLDLGEGTKKDDGQLKRLKEEIPAAVLADWEKRHQLNYDANAALIDLTRDGVLSFFFLGGDDSAPLSQTHYECRHLKEYGRDLGKTKFQVISGADELAMVMVCRAVNDSRWEIPFVYTAYNEGEGRDTIPSYCFEKIGEDVDATITAAGGMRIPAPERADLVLAIHTNPDGKTGEANSPSNTTRPRAGTKHFTAMVKDFVERGYPVGVGDVAYANGADNALMEQFRKEDLQFRLRAYAGWNTATNSTGFLIGAGLLTKWMDEDAVQRLLLKRYLDEWAYQANIRGRLGNEIWNFPGDGDGSKLNGKRAAVEEAATKWMGEFAERNIRLPEGLSLKKLRVTHPWNRLFECRIEF